MHLDEFTLMSHLTGSRISVEDLSSKSLLVPVNSGSQPSGGHSTMLGAVSRSGKLRTSLSGSGKVSACCPDASTQVATAACT